MSRIMIVVEFEVKPEHRNAFIELMKGHARRSRAEDGCQQFDVLLPQEDPEPRLAGRSVARPGGARRAFEMADAGEDARNLPALAGQPQGDALYRGLTLFQGAARRFGALGRRPVPAERCRPMVISLAARNGRAVATKTPKSVAPVRNSLVAGFSIREGSTRLYGSSAKNTPAALRCHRCPVLPARAQTGAFLDLGRRYRPGERAAQLLGRFQRQLDRDPRARPQRAVHEIDRDRLFQQSVVRVVVGHHRVGQLEPPVLALAGAVGADDLDDRGAHAARLLSCRQVLLQEREHLLPAVERLLDAVGRPVVVEEAVPGAVIAVELVVLAVLLQLGLVLVDLLRGRRAVLVAEQTEQRAGQVLA